MPPGTAAATTLTLAFLAYLVTKLNLGYLSSAVILAASYAGQELAHIISREATYQSSYQGTTGWVPLLVEHTLFLLPLCVDSAAHVTSLGEVLPTLPSELEPSLQQYILWLLTPARATSGRTAGPRLRND